jgi:hypothetical protein
MINLMNFLNQFSESTLPNHARTIREILMSIYLVWVMMRDALYELAASISDDAWRG